MKVFKHRGEGGQLGRGCERFDRDDSGTAAESMGTRFLGPGRVYGAGSTLRTSQTNPARAGDKLDGRREEGRGRKGKVHSREIVFSFIRLYSLVR